MSDLFQRARIQLLLHHPFFGVLAIHLIEREMTSAVEKMVGVPTCATDGRYLYINPDWVGTLSEDERQGLLAHECMHAALGHVFDWRRGHRDRLKWNVAGDYVINLMLKEAGFKLPPDGCLDDKFKDMATEQVYEMLPDPKKMKIKIMVDVLSAEGSGNKNEKKDGKSEGKPGKKGKGGSSGGDTPKDGEGESEVPGLTPSQQKELEQNWKDLVSQAAFSAKMRGKLPAGIERLVDRLMNPRIPWYQLLEQFTSDVIRDDYDMLYPDRRFLQEGIYLPDLRNEGVDVAIGIDTSGSIGESDLREFLSETMGILNSRKVKTIRLIACDAAISLDEEILPGDILPSKLGGGGGTSFVPVFDRLKDSRIACCIFFTDLFGSFPREHPNFPCVWITKTDPKQAMPPFGTVIRYDPEDKCALEVVQATGDRYQDD